MKNNEINFKNIPSDLEPDEKITLWRYMSFASLCEILMNDHIPLISIRNFSDKSEGVILREILSKLPNVYVHHIEYAMQRYYESTYVSSWHKAKNENAAMWDRYTHGGEGVAIKTNAKLLLDCIPQQSVVTGGYTGLIMPRTPSLNEGDILPDRVIIKPIKYIANKPSDFEMREEYFYNGYDKMCFFYKFIDFQDESEVRILTSPFVNPFGYAMMDPDIFESNFQRNRQGNDTVSFENSLSIKIDSANDLIQKIVVSPYAHDQFIKTVKQCIENINVCRQLQEKDLIKCCVNESRRKEWV